MDYRLALMTGADIPIPECQLIIHQPSIREISMIGEKSFFIGAQCLTINKTMFIQDKNLLSQINNFQIFMTIIQEKKAADKKEATEKVLFLLFPQYKILFTPNSLLFNPINKNNNESIIIDETNFEILQNYLRDIFCVTNGPMDQQSFNPGGKKAQEIAKKLQRGRERIAAEKGNKTSSILSQYLSIITVGLSIPLKYIIELTMYQLYDIIERYHLWIAWDLDTKTRLAGGKPDHKPDNWMKNIHN